MVELPFGTRLVAAVGGAPLAAPGFGAAHRTAIALPAITMSADPEHGAASLAEANPLSENNLAMNVHPRQPAGLDNGDRSWQVRTSFDAVVTCLRVARQIPGRLQRPGIALLPAIHAELYTSG
jgi:hypothetical protein